MTVSVEKSTDDVNQDCVQSIKKRGGGRPKKYATPEEAKAARHAQKMKWQHDHPEIYKEKNLRQCIAYKEKRRIAKEARLALKNGTKQEAIG